MENTDKIAHRAMYEIIADKLEAMILGDSTHISEKLPSEQYLAGSFGVSRPVIREALKLLKERGLITSRQGASSYITEYSTESFAKSINRIAYTKNVSPEQIYEVRTVVEMLATTLAAKNSTSVSVQKLKEINTQLSKETSIHEKARLDIEFHAAISSMSGNPLVEYMTESLSSLLMPLVEKCMTEDTVNDAVISHEKIITAIAEGNEEAAGDLMRSHLMRSIRNFEVFNK